MIHFLRKLRGKEMKGTRYFKYAVGEIFLVVIGILIALSINNLNEDRKKGNRERDLLLQLNYELSDTREELAIDLANAHIYYNLTDSIIHYDEIENKKPFIEYFKPYDGMAFYYNSKLFGSKSTYTTLKSVGLEIIQNSTLRNNITDLYERRLKRIEGVEEVIFKYSDRLIEKMESSFSPHYLEGTEELILLPDSYKSFDEIKEFKNMLISMQRYRRVGIERYNVVDSIANVIQVMIETETKN